MKAVILTLALAPMILLAADPRKEAIERISEATTVMDEIMSAPDEGIPEVISPRNGIVTKAGWITTAIVALPIVYAASALQVAPAVETSRTAQSSSESLRFESAARIASLATQTVSGLLAQDITGTWQGKLIAPNGEIRIVFKILKADGAALKGTFYMIDRPVPGLPASAVAIQGSNVTITIPGIGGTYEGKLDAEATTMTGKWTAGGMPMPLTLAHVKDDAAWEIPKPPPAPRMMAADADPVFEVATIKPSDPNRPGRRLFSIGSTELTTFYTTVNDLIVFAYGVHAGQISGAPAWVESDKFDITGKPEGGGQPNPNQFKTMLQKLLADRFQLTLHRDKKQLTVYALTVGKNGPKLTRSEAASSIPNLIFRAGNWPVRNATMEEFAGVMQAHLDRPVVDQTGLKGRFDFQLQWTPDETPFASPGGPGEPPKPPERETQPDLFTAIQQQLGLKLESTRAQTDVLVIDKVEKPSEN
jgi:bla regulator protein blaR1